MTRPAAASFRRSTRSSNPTLFEGDGASALTALTLKYREEDIVSGDRKGIRKTDEKPLPVGKKRKGQEISLTTETEEGENKKKGRKAKRKVVKCQIQ